MGALVVSVELEVVTAVVVSAALEVAVVLVGSSSFASPETQYSARPSNLAQSRSGLRDLSSLVVMPQLSAKVSQVSPELAAIVKVQSTPRREKPCLMERAEINPGKRAKARTDFPYIMTILLNSSNDFQEPSRSEPDWAIASDNLCIYMHFERLSTQLAPNDMVDSNSSIVSGRLVDPHPKSPAR